MTQAQRIRQGAHEDHSLVFQRLAARHPGVTAELGQLIETGAGEPRFGVSGSERQRRGPVPGGRRGGRG